MELQKNKTEARSDEKHVQMITVLVTTTNRVIISCNQPLFVQMQSGDLGNEH
jgi:hypothetical protein